CRRGRGRPRCLAVRRNGSWGFALRLPGMSLDPRRTEPLIGPAPASEHANGAEAVRRRCWPSTPSGAPGPLGCYPIVELVPTTAATLDHWRHGDCRTGEPAL